MTVPSVGGFPTIFLVKAYKSSVLFFVTCLHVLAKLPLESSFRGKDSSVVPVLRTQEALDKYLWSRWVDGCMDGWTHGWMHRWIDGFYFAISHIFFTAK